MKTFETYRKYLKYLLWPGLALTTAGVVSGSLGGLTLLPVGLLLGGVVLLGIGSWFAGYYSLISFWRRRSTQVGTNVLIATVAMVVILALVNFLAVRYSARLDLTENQLFTLAPQSKEVVKSLSEPVKIFIFDSIQNPLDKQLLQRYRRQNSLFSYEYVDPFAEPLLSQQFGVERQGEVYLEVGDNRLLVQQVSLQERLTERQLTNQLEQIVSDRSTLTLYFLQGHGEYEIDGADSGFSKVAASLENKNYTAAPLDFAETPEPPEDASVIVIAGPRQDFFESEIKALETYLDQGGSLLLLIDPNTDPKLDSLLANWGVTLDDRLVLDTSGGGQLVGQGPAAPLVTDYGEHPITKGLGNGRSFYPVARSINITEIPGVTATPLLFTNAQSQAVQLSERGEFQFDPSQPLIPEGPFILGVALSQELTEIPGASEGDADASPPPEAAPEGQPIDTNNSENTTAETSAPEARLVVIGNATFATDGYFEQQLNGDVFLNAISWLGRQDNEATLSIRPKEATNRRIVMTVQQQLAVGVLALLILPLSGFIGAIVMWLKRR